MNMFRFALILTAITCYAQNAAIRWEGGVFRVAGWHAEDPPAAGWSSVFSVYAGSGDVPPLLGAYTVEGGTLAFQPRFPVSAGMHVRAVFQPPAGPKIEAAFDMPKAIQPSSSTRVAHVYPSTDLLPENQLKFYIYFSASVQKGEAWSRIHLLDENGNPITLPFLEIDQELWDRENQRLTVLFDPGRIKRGLLPLKEMGPAIENGKRYTLLIDRDWSDGKGAPLLEDFRKSFRVGPPDREPIDPAKWKITAPRAGTTDGLVIDFGEPLDYALLQHCIDVAGIKGVVSVDRNETRWQFTPDQPWKPGGYKVDVQTALEDLSGNHVGRVFDVDVFEKVTKSVPKEKVTVPFRVR